MLSLFQFQPSMEFENFHHYDGRGNIRVGTGKFYARDYGRTVEVECRFPSHGRLLSPIKWLRSSSSNRHSPASTLHFPQSGFSSNRKYDVRSLGPNASVLIIRDYNRYEDDGVYRCFSLRQRSSTYGGGGGQTERVFVQTDVHYSFSGSSGGSGGGGILSTCGGYCK